MFYMRGNMVRVLTMGRKSVWIEIINIVSFSPKKSVMLDIACKHKKRVKTDSRFLA